MKIVRNISLFLLLLGVVGCTSESEGPQEPAVKPQEPKIIYEGATQLHFAAQESVQSLSFEATASWSATSDQSWCELSSTEGQAGEQQLEIRVQANPDYVERNAEVQLRCAEHTVRLLVIQKFSDALLLSSSKVELPSAGGDFSLELQSTAKPSLEIVEGEGWIHPRTTRALSDYTLHFEVDENPETTLRSGKIRLSVGELQEEVMVYQQGSEPTLVLNLPSGQSNEFILTSDRGELCIELMSNVDYRVVLPEVDWLTEPVTRTSSFTHRFEVAENLDYESRTAEIRFLCEAYELEQVVRVVQLQRDAILVAASSYEVPASGGELRFEVLSNVDFQVDLSAEWIVYQDLVRSMESTPLLFVVEPNSDTAPREAVITLSHGELQQQIVVLQAAAEPMSLLKITYSASQVLLPYLYGTGLSGTLDWGDGTVENYVEQVTSHEHTYDQAGDHTVSLQLRGLEEVQFLGVEGVTLIDLSAM